MEDDFLIKGGDYPLAVDSAALSSRKWRFFPSSTGLEEPGVDAYRVALQERLPAIAGTVTGKLPAEATEEPPNEWLME